jgi:hypothetical protein
MLNKAYMIILQILFIFVFLTVFFFTYVNTVEKETFQSQINMVIDSIFTDDINIQNIYNNDATTIALNGSLDLARKNAINSLQQESDNISSSNKTIENKSFMYVIIFIIVFVCLSGILYVSKQHIEFKEHTREALISVFFVGVTEYIFLTFITRQYYSVDPNQVKFKIGQSVQNYIKNNNKIKI